MNRAREVGDKTEAFLAKRIRLLERAVEIRRFDVLADDIASIATREARSADTFVALRLNGAMDPERLVHGVLVGSGRHLFLVPRWSGQQAIVNHLIRDRRGPSSRQEPP